MPNARRKRSTSIRTALSFTTEKKLVAYIIAAAAGLGLQRTSAAEVVFVPAHQQLFPNHALTLDLNSDGIADFRIVDRNYANVFRRTGSSLATTALMYVETPTKSNQVAGGLGGFAAALDANVVVGPGGNFLRGNRKPLMWYCRIITNDGSRSSRGLWQYQVNRYLGLKFLINGETHYGWARLSVFGNNSNCFISARLTGYAYETDPNTPILTGQRSDSFDLPQDSQDLVPGTLGTLAHGTLRREPRR
jgi:hypothetical protein